MRVRVRVEVKVSSSLQALFTAELIEACEEGVGAEQTVVQGDARDRSRAGDCESISFGLPPSDPSLDGTPRVAYPQGDEPTCVFMSAASAIHACGLVKHAEILASLRSKSLDTTDRMRHLYEQVRKVWPLQVRSNAVSSFC